MRTLPLGTSSLTVNNLNFKRQSSHSYFSSSSSRASLSHQTSSSPSKLGVCRASQVVELFPTVSPEIFVREARLEDCWEVAETHCSCFFPEYSFPLDLLLRVDRMFAMLSGFTVQHGYRRICLVAVVSSSVDETFFLGSEDFKIGGLDGIFSLNRGYVAGILTVDTVADFLPRKGPLRQRRSVDYILLG
ncbi:hypothetical protein Patl1_06094 [Pistacia atlantica]|uniref:Uncharacterized protein n=1 Tax=Pistacia atlantica TaxID=434234 RepID=A0ACC1BRI1_9ROSI|nr:hypothetical protein Patl1_06094 [Pistacia atlantica]